MIKKLRFFLFIVFFVYITNLNAQKTGPKIEILSLLIQKKDDFDSFSAFHDQKTEVKLKITLATNEHIFKIDKKNSKLFSFIDDKGNDILKKGRMWRQTKSYFTSIGENSIDFNSISIEENSIVVPINITAIPNKNATSIIIRAKLLLYAYDSDSKLQSFTTDFIDLKNINLDSFHPNNETISFDNYFIKLDKYSTMSMGNNDEMSLFEYDTNTIINKIIFYDDKRQEIGSTRPDTREISINSSIIDKIKKIKMEYTKPILVEVPINIETNGIGI